MITTSALGMKILWLKTTNEEYEKIEKTIIARQIIPFKVVLDEDQLDEELKSKAKMILNIP